MSAPIRYPQIQLNGTGPLYRIKYSLSAIVRMREWKIPSDIPATQEAGWQQLSAQVAASACVEDDGKMKYAGLTQESVDAAYDGDPDLADMAYLRDALDTAISFRMPPAESSQAETAQTTA